VDYGYLSGASSGREGAGSIWYSLILIKLSVKAYGKKPLGVTTSTIKCDSTSGPYSY
jgi:hypothetical protein